MQSVKYSNGMNICIKMYVYLLDVFITIIFSTLGVLFAGRVLYFSAEMFRRPCTTGTAVWWLDTFMRFRSGRDLCQSLAIIVFGIPRVPIYTLRVDVYSRVFIRGVGKGSI